MGESFLSKMIKRLFLYFSVVLVIVLVATSFNRFYLDKKKTVDQAFDGTTQFFQQPADDVGGLREIANEEAMQDLAKIDLEKSDPKFIKWFQGEALQVNSTSVDFKSKELELMAKAKSLNSRQIEYLKTTTVSPSTPQVEKILSVYLLTLGGEATQSALVEIATKDLNLTPAEPHSLDEIKNNQERAKAIMAIDALAESKSQLSDRLVQLQKIIAQAQDKSIKNYAQRKHDELQSSSN